jgi:hypothetical protein
MAAFSSRNFLCIRFVPTPIGAFYQSGTLSDHVLRSLPALLELLQGFCGRLISPTPSCSPSLVD